MADFPLIKNYASGAVFAYREGRPIHVEEFLGEAEQLARALPDRPHVVNLCSDRYRFTVSLAAALLRGQVSLFPPNSTPDLLGRLGEVYSSVYCLSDGSVDSSQLETFPYPSLQGSAATGSNPRIPEAQAAAVLFTSGSTGQPVPHAKSWGSLVRTGSAEVERLGLESGMVLVSTVPQQHMYGFESTVLMVMQGGMAMHAGKPFFPADVCAELEALPRPRGLVTTPVHLRILLAETSSLPPVDFLLCATAPLSPQLATEAEARFAAPLFEIYGCTEAGQVASRRPTRSQEWRLFPGLKLHADGNRARVSGGHVESEVLLGDVIEVCSDDTFLLHGRTADLVNIAGKRTSLAHLNFHLNSIAGVKDGTFVMPEEDDGTVTRLMALVVAPGISSDAVMSALRQRIDAAFLPRPLCFVDSLPRNDTGKLPRVALDRLVSRLAKAG
jgi:acyl-coenzyme A synthetase/AMP-(fatty) acid ligase